MRSRMAVLAMVAATQTAACGGGASKPSVVVSVSGAEFSFTPSSLSLTTRGGTLRFTNTGTTPHDLAIPGLGLGTREIPAGATVDLVIDSPRTGVYPFRCDITGHAQAGMVGTLTVTKS